VTPPTLHLSLGFLSSFGDAFTFIFDGQSSTTTGGAEVGGPASVWEHTREHLKVTFLALAVAILIAMPPGLLLGHQGRGERFAIAFGNAGRALPELALIALFFAFLGSGVDILVLALMILGIPPILTNCYVGVRQVDPGAVQAARGMGMTELGIITRVELPLAIPTIMGGVRTAAINIVATATIGVLVGVETLGDYIINRNVFGDSGVLAGAIMVALLAVLIELGLAGLQYLMTPAGLRAERAPA
jgi:osmoprotectant transport system permease protein